MQIAVCDDEKEIREMFAEKIRELYPKEEISLYQSGGAAVVRKGAGYSAA